MSEFEELKGWFEKHFAPKPRAFGVIIGEGGFESMEEIFAYLDEARKHGCQEVMMFLGLTREMPSNLPDYGFPFLPIEAEEATQISAKAKELGMVPILEIWPKTFKESGAKPSDLKPYADMGLSGLRLDWGFTPSEVAEMTRNKYGLKIAINASDSFVDMFLEETIEAKANLEQLLGWFNLYPHIDTGHSLEYVVERAKAFKKYGLKVNAMVAGQKHKVGPLCQGLPTVEKHRYLSPARAAEELFATKVIDTVFVADIASPEELEALGEVCSRYAIKLRVKLEPGVSEVERKILFEKGTIFGSPSPHINRYDLADNVVRSTLFRGTKVTPHNTVERPKYSVTISNVTSLLRYSGDLHITKKDLPRDHKINVVGHVIEEDQNLVEMIGPGSWFILEEVE